MENYFIEFKNNFFNIRRIIIFKKEKCYNFIWEFFYEIKVKGSYELIWID